jgi:hypothetical protein
LCASQAEHGVLLESDLKNLMGVGSLHRVWRRLRIKILKTGRVEQFKGRVAGKEDTLQP